MLRPDSISLRPLAALAATLSLSAIAGAQTYTAKAGPDVAGSGDGQVTSNPALAFWDGSWAQSTRHAWSRAEQGALEGSALCQTYAKYNMSAYAIAEFKYDDVVFTSPNPGPIQVGLKLLIQGNCAVVNGNSFKVSLKRGAQGIGEAWMDSSGSVTSTHDLAGWSMTRIFPFEHALTVPVNTPVSLRVSMVIFASGSDGGHDANGHYTLRLGGASPIPAPGERYEVFSLPPGVTVDSVQGGISDNIWTESEDLYLSARSTVVAPGESLQLVPWNGVPGEPVGFSIGWAPAPPLPAIGPKVWTGYIGTLDGDGWWWADPIPNSPELAGATMRVRAVSFDGGGKRVRSREVAVLFQ